MKVVDRIIAGYQHGIEWGRRRSKTFDHFWRARQRYNEVLGGRLAAAISYYGFFAAFSLTLLGYSILGYLPQSSGVLRAANTYLRDNLALINITSLQGSRNTVTAIGLISLVLTGVGWVEALRSSQRAVWHLDQEPGNVVIRRLVDLGMLVGLGLLLGLSLATSTAIEGGLNRVLAGRTGVVSVAVLRWSGPALEFIINVVLAAALLAAVPRLRMSLRRLMPVALIMALGIQILNILGRYLISRTQHRAAYALVAGAAGLLVYLYLLNQLIVFTSAVLATARRGYVVDLAAGPPPAGPPERTGADGSTGAGRPPRSGGSAESDGPSRPGGEPG